MKVQEKALSGLKENIDVEDEPTRRVNEQFYADKIIDSEQELQVKRQEERKVFELLFRMQESLKQRDEMMTLQWATSGKD